MISPTDPGFWTAIRLVASAIDPTLLVRCACSVRIDGHQPDAAIHYAKLCREAGVLSLLDGGGLRSNTHELLGFIDVAIVAERLCQQMGHDPAAMLDYLKTRGCRFGGVTLGERGLSGIIPRRSTSAGPLKAASGHSGRAVPRHLLPSLSGPST